MTATNTRGYRKLLGASAISNLGDGVGQLAYPWLATAVTRNPLLIALIAVVRGLPWLLFSLPAGVIVDRKSRRLLMVVTNGLRMIITVGVVAAVVSASDLASPQEVNDGIVPSGNLGLYVVLVVATLLLGVCEVLYDSAAVAFIPEIVHSDDLEKANGRLWSTEQVANSFVGPPLGAFLIAGGFALPFIFDAVSFIASALLVATIISTINIRSDADGPYDAVGTTKPVDAAATGSAFEPGSQAGTSATGSALVDGVDTRPGWRVDLAEGVAWLRSHELLRPLAIVLGLFNGLLALAMATLVLFAQEVLGTSTIEFAVLGMSGACGGVIGGLAASPIIAKLGGGPTLWAALGLNALAAVAAGLAPHWFVVWLALAVMMLMGTVWNVLTVSLRQRIIPSELLGRVNSVYRFLGLGMIPIGAFLGGLIVVGLDPLVGSEWSLRLPWVIVGVLLLGVLGYAAPRLTSGAIERAEAEAKQRVPARS